MRKIQCPWDRAIPQWLFFAISMAYDYVVLLNKNVFYYKAIFIERLIYFGKIISSQFCDLNNALSFMKGQI